jgi:hypothetical protein
LPNPTPFPEPAAAFGFSLGTDPNAIVEVFPHPLLFTPVELPELVLDPELPIEPDPVLEPWLAPEPLDVTPPLLLAGGVLAVSDVPLLSELRELAMLPRPEVDPVLLAEVDPELGLLELVPHATAIRTKNAGRGAHARWRSRRPMARS